MECPKCKGEKEMRIAFPHNRNKPTIPCMQCKGTGEVPEEMIKWMQDGEILKEKRIAKKMILREASKCLAKNEGIDSIVAVMRISEMERGVIKPDMTLYDNL